VAPRAAVHSWCMAAESVHDVDDLAAATAAFLEEGSAAAEEFRGAYLRWRTRLVDPLWVPSGDGPEPSDPRSMARCVARSA
jgi:hypothetical protein